MIKYILTEKAKELQSRGIDVSPKRGTEFAAGMDLAACIDEPVTIYPGAITKIYTGLKIFLGTETSLYKGVNLAGLYLPRSSNTEMVLANTVGLLDADFQNESFLKVTARENSFIINPGDRIAQLVVFPAILFPWEEVSEFSEKTSRIGGDGSTGGNYNHVQTITEFNYDDAQKYLDLSDRDMIHYTLKSIPYTLSHGAKRFKKTDLDRFKTEVLNKNKGKNDRTN